MVRLFRDLSLYCGLLATAAYATSVQAQSLSIRSESGSAAPAGSGCGLALRYHLTEGSAGLRFRMEVNSPGTLVVTGNDMALRACLGDSCAGLWPMAAIKRGANQITFSATDGKGCRTGITAYLDRP